MNKRLALLILIFTFGSTANTSEITPESFFESLDATIKEEKLELMNKVLTQGEIINQGYTKSEHSFVVIYKRKLYSCHIQYDSGGCLEIEEPIF